MSKKTISPHYNIGYDRYDLDIEDIVSGLKAVGYLNSDDNNEITDDDLTNSLDPSYRLEIYTSNGSRFNTTAFSTVLYPRLYKNNIDITDSISTSCFKWVRISGNNEVAKKEDAEFNLRFASGSKECPITRTDVTRRATFRCLFMQYAEDEYIYVNKAYDEYIKNNQ